jgi:hypothetical protein
MYYQSQTITMAMMTMIGKESTVKVSKLKLQVDI